MTDSDFTFIQPLETVHNVQNVAPAQQREERKRRQKPPRQQQESGEKPQNETPPEPTQGRDDDPHEVDYRA